MEALCIQTVLSQEDQELLADTTLAGGLPVTDDDTASAAQYGAPRASPVRARCAMHALDETYSAHMAHMQRNLAARAARASGARVGVLGCRLHPRTR